MFAQNNYLLRRLSVVLMLLLVFGFSEQLYAQQQDPNKQKDFFEMSIEELMDVPVVVSAARQPQKIGQLSVPVSVITDEDIHYSGLTNIPEVMQFAPGMDVLKFNRFSYAVGIRGLHELSSDRVQSLVNGRLMDNTIYGGPEFWNLPVSKEIAAGKGELMLGVSDLLDKSHDPFIQCDTFTAHQTPGRTFFARLQLKF